MHIQKVFFYFQTKTLWMCLTVCILVCISSGYWEWNSFPPAAVCGGEDADHHGTKMFSLESCLFPCYFPMWTDRQWTGSDQLYRLCNKWQTSSCLGWAIHPVESDIISCSIFASIICSITCFVLSSPVADDDIFLSFSFPVISDKFPYLTFLWLLSVPADGCFDRCCGGCVSDRNHCASPLPQI